MCPPDPVDLYSCQRALEENDLNPVDQRSEILGPVKSDIAAKDATPDRAAGASRSVACMVPCRIS